MNGSKKFLVAPLNWGLGHATRCIPIIQELLNQNQHVFIASDGRALELLKKEFPGLTFFNLPSYPHIYPDENGSMAGKMLLSFPFFLRTVFKEHHQIKKIILQNKIDVVISDNRYGARSEKIKSIFITHQINIRCPENLKWMERFINKLNHLFISKFSTCWIPDSEGQSNLSGELSHPCKLKIPFQYIGPLSRFTGKSSKREAKYDLLILLSGPEPQRTILEKNLMKQLTNTGKKILIVKGVTEAQEEKSLNDKISTVNYLKSEDLLERILESEMIISRSGYSGIMDLVTLGKRAIFIPTPRQTEQEYLAKYFHDKGIFYFQEQNKFDLSASLNEAKSYNGFHANKCFSHFIPILNSLI